MGTSALVVLSGGQDSTTCLFWAKQNFDEVWAITFDYGQRHLREVEAAFRVAQMAEIGIDRHEIVRMGRHLKGTSPLVSNARLEQYESYKVLPGGLEKTFVPMRNQFFLTLAANHAYVKGINHLVTGVCQEDFGGYPDCRRIFIDAFEAASNLGTFTGEDGAPGPLHIHTPLMFLTKEETVRLALDLPGCYSALQWSHTAYDGAYPPTGYDHATLLRAKGFAHADVPDPLILRAAAEGRMPLPNEWNYRQDILPEFTRKLTENL